MFTKDLAKQLRDNKIDMFTKDLVKHVMVGTLHGLSHFEKNIGCQHYWTLLWKC